MSNKKPILDSQAYITLGYLAIVVIGMMFDYKYYSHFAINIFEYADILDFLLAPVKNLELILFALGSLILVLIFFRIDQFWQDRWPKTYKRFNFGMSIEALKKYRPFIIALSSIAYLNLASKFYGDRMFERFQSSPKTVEVVFQSDERVLKGNLIGKNTDYILMQTEGKVIKAIPVSSDVQEIIIHRP
ncbi:hypothetical protein [Roseivirga thermotolerans]|uniref:Uncharacterized protein n=1 Tax=Roseivirga thermotolerans TaxID=1758176 RepID=A0ABQ3IAE1_9BACT|nr:hypothetical protein [Roseivirga thermotolerans]GHE65579.1 hypothetical protein GCM10011340_20890 [Roseivirga thermotolerans]